jgi:FkbM family methyltransferase
MTRFLKMWPTQHCTSVYNDEAYRKDIVSFAASIKVKLMPFPVKVDSLKRLRSSGLCVNAVFDVGVNYSTPELIDVFPDKKHYLFEPVPAFHHHIEWAYSQLDFELFPCAVAGVEGEADLAISSLDGGEATHGHLQSVEGAAAGAESIRVQTLRLETILDRSDVPTDVLLKVDVDGLELQIMESVGACWDKVSAVIVEASRSKLFERGAFMEQRGFELFDLVDLCYYDGLFAQCDLIFVSRREFRKPAFRPWERRFDWEKWVGITHRSAEAE